VQVSGRFLVLVSVITVVSLTPAPLVGQGSPARSKAKKTAAAKTWTPPLTPDGQPDLQGIWLSNSATPLERPKALEGRQFLTDEEVAELKKRAQRLFKDGKSDYAAGDNAFLAAFGNAEQYKNPNLSAGSSLEMVEREFDNRTSLIVDPPDGKVPALTPEARQRQASVEARQRLPAGPEDLSNPLRCVTFGVPRLGGNFGAGPYSYYQIVQAPGYVVIIMEIIHEARIIPLDGRPHISGKIRQWNGDSRGRWEGKTLVVDTANFSPNSYFMGSAENLHLIERFTRVAPGTINYEITLDDATTWARPWTAVIRLKQSRDNIYEFACHEGNESVMVGMLAGARAEEKAAGAPKKDSK
jgi:hypothetical protein